MADVIDRGQLILVTGLVMAIGSVALALLLNTAIYTENLASRGSDVGARDAIEFRHTTIEAIGDIIQEENEREHGSRSAVRTNVTDGIDRFDQLRSTRAAETGVLVDLVDLDANEGTHLRQTDSGRQLVDVSDNHNWTLTQGTDGVRNYTVTVSGGLEDTSTPRSDAFNVSVIGSGGNRWSLYLYNDTLLGGRQIAVRNGLGTFASDVCSSLLPASPPFTVNLSAGTVDGSACSVIEFAKGTTPPYDVVYTWGNRSEGTYRLTVNATTTSGFAAFGDPGPPEKIPVIYGVAVDVTYRSDELTYRERVGVRPGGSP